MKEILSTEKTYVDLLQKLEKIFIFPLRTNGFVAQKVSQSKKEKEKEKGKERERRERRGFLFNVLSVVIMIILVGQDIQEFEDNVHSILTCNSTLLARLLEVKKIYQLF